MRKVLIPVAALVLCAGPAAAQQSLAAEAATPAQAAVAQAAEPQTPAANPSLFPTTAHVKAQVEAAESQRHARAPIGTRDWWALVAAVALGVLIVAVLL